MLVIASVNVDVQEAALVEVRAPRNTRVRFLNAINQVDQRGFKVLAYCNELDSANEQHQWREVSPPRPLSLAPRSHSDVFCTMGLKFPFPGSVLF